MAHRVLGGRGDRVGAALGLAVRADERGLAGLEDERVALEIETEQARERRGRDYRADRKREDV